MPGDVQHLLVLKTAEPHSPRYSINRVRPSGFPAFDQAREHSLLHTRSHCEALSEPDEERAASQEPVSRIGTLGRTKNHVRRLASNINIYVCRHDHFQPRAKLGNPSCYDGPSCAKKGLFAQQLSPKAMDVYAQTFAKREACRGENTHKGARRQSCPHLSRGPAPKDIGGREQSHKPSTREHAQLHTLVREVLPQRRAMPP